jgi:hypothetical protein
VQRGRRLPARVSRGASGARSTPQRTAAARRRSAAAISVDRKKKELSRYIKFGRNKETKEKEVRDWRHP